MGKTITHLLTATVVAVGGITAAAAPAQAADDPRITCSYLQRQTVYPRLV